MEGAKCAESRQWCGGKIAEPGVNACRVSVCAGRLVSEIWLWPHTFGRYVEDVTLKHLVTAARLRGKLYVPE